MTELFYSIKWIIVLGATALTLYYAYCYWYNSVNNLPMSNRQKNILTGKMAMAIFAALAFAVV